MKIILQHSLGKMKKAMLILAAAAMLCAGSCAKLSLLSDSVKKEKEAVKHFEKVFFDAIENNDGEKLKSCFSPRALEQAGDIDKGIEYVLKAYNDGKATITDDNISSYTEYKKNAGSRVIHGKCEFRSGENNYLVKWTEWLKYEADPDMVGVYSVELFDLSESADTTFYDIAGIAYPERRFLDDSIGTIFNFDGVTENTTDIFSEELLEEADSYQLECLLDFIGRDARIFNRMWVENSGGSYTAYADLRFAMEDYIMALKYNDEKKIIAVSAAGDINGTDLRDCRITGVSEMLNK